MEDLLYDEFDFSQYDPLANINAILVEIAQKSLDIKEVATEMEGFENASPDKVAQMDIIEQEIQELKKRADYYLAHITKLWFDKLCDDIYSLVSHIIVNKNTIRVEFDYRGFNYAQIEIDALNKCKYEYCLESYDDNNNSERFEIPPYHQPLQYTYDYGYVDLNKAYKVFTELIEKIDSLNLIN